MRKQSKQISTADCHTNAKSLSKHAGKREVSQRAGEQDRASVRAMRAEQCEGRLRVGAWWHIRARERVSNPNGVTTMMNQIKVKRPERAESERAQVCIVVAKDSERHGREEGVEQRSSRESSRR